MRAYYLPRGVPLNVFRDAIVSWRHSGRAATMDEWGGGSLGEARWFVAVGRIFFYST